MSTPYNERHASRTAMHPSRIYHAPTRAELNDAIEERRVEKGIALLGRLDCKRIILNALGAVQAPFLLCLAQVGRPGL